MALWTWSIRAIGKAILLSLEFFLAAAKRASTSNFSAAAQKITVGKLRLRCSTCQVRAVLLVYFNGL